MSQTLSVISSSAHAPIIVLNSQYSRRNSSSKPRSSSATTTGLHQLPAESYPCQLTDTERETEISLSHKMKTGGTKTKHTNLVANCRTS